MTVLDFLFEGKPPQSVTTYGQTIENVPKWMSDYTQGLIAKANAAAAEPYIPYGGPRIASFAPEQEQAFEMGRENVGNWQPFVEGSTAATVDVLGGPSGLEQAQPYLDQGTQDFPGSVDQYMNPYIQHVLDRQEELAGRTLNEKFLPALDRRFVGAGQFGSRGVGAGSDSMEATGVRGVRGIMEGLESQRLATLGAAYGQAGDLFGADRARDLTAGQTAGTLGIQGDQINLMGAQQLGALGEFTQQAGFRDVGMMEGIGATQQGQTQRSLDVAYGDFREQRDLPLERTGFMSEIIRGLPTSAVGRSTSTQDYGPASTYQPSPLSQAVGAYGVYQGLTQARGGRITRARGGPVTVEGDYRVVDDGYMVGGFINNADPREHNKAQYGGYGDYRRGGLARYAAGGKLRPMTRGTRWAA